MHRNMEAAHHVYFPSPFSDHSFISSASYLFCRTRRVSRQPHMAGGKRVVTKAPVVIVPFGAGAKEHGPHLPMNADFKVVEYLCKKAVESHPVIVAPPIQHGWFPAFREFPGTEIAESDVFVRYVFLVAKSLVDHGAKRILFLNHRDFTLDRVADFIGCARNSK